jgi:NAD(P)-dependent dehydrogenase (short-subunit alcohol dehydrogenase family)
LQLPFLPCTLCAACARDHGSNQFGGSLSVQILIDGDGIFAATIGKIAEVSLVKKIVDISDEPLTQLLSLAGRGAVVTGGARGLGKAIAKRLAEAGAKIVIGDVDETVARDTAQEISEKYSARVIGTYMDVTKTDTVSDVVQIASEQLGGIDIWVNNAGIYPYATVLDTSDALWDKVFAVNVRGLFVGSREAARLMIAQERGGVIINLVSTAGFRGLGQGISAYVGSKHAVRGITRQMALELAPHAIRVLGVAPTFCLTEGNAATLKNDPRIAVDLPSAVTSRLGRVGAPDDIARAVLFCASDMSILMTGSTLLLDAGETI